MFYPVEQPNTYLTSSYFGNLGYAWPTTLGAKVAQPDRAAVCISGDGGFLFNSQELATAVQHGINAVAIVFNDNAYGNVMRDQADRFGGRIIGSKLHNPDFMKLADAYGARGVRAETPAALEDRPPRLHRLQRRANPHRGALRPRRLAALTLMPPTQITIDIPNVSIAALRDGDGPRLLFIHDELSSAWTPFLDLLAERFEVIAPELPGFGCSERPEWADTIDDLAFAVADLADALAPTAIVGASLGGWLAVEAAVRGAPACRARRHRRARHRPSRRPADRLLRAEAGRTARPLLRRPRMRAGRGRGDRHPQREHDGAPRLAAPLRQPRARRTPPPTWARRRSSSGARTTASSRAPTARRSPTARRTGGLRSWTTRATSPPESSRRQPPRSSPGSCMNSPLPVACDERSAIVIPSEAQRSRGISRETPRCARRLPERCFDSAQHDKGGASDSAQHDEGGASGSAQHDNAHRRQRVVKGRPLSFRAKRSGAEESLGRRPVVPEDSPRDVSTPLNMTREGPPAPLNMTREGPPAPLNMTTRTGGSA